MKKYLLPTMLILATIIILILTYSAISHSSVTINGQAIDSPFKLLGGFWGMIISASVLIFVGILLVFILSSTGFILLGILSLVGVILSFVFLPIFLPLLLPLAILWAIFRKPKNNKNEEA